MTVDLSSGNIEAANAQAEQKPKKSWVTEVWLKLKWNEAAGRTVVEMNGREFTEFEPLEADLESLAELSADSPIILDIDGRVPAGDVIRVDDACRAAGFQTINYADRPRQAQTETQELKVAVTNFAGRR